MKKVFKLLLFTFALLILSTNKINADTLCDTTKLYNYGKYASNIAYSYTYNEIKGKDGYNIVTFDVLFTNVESKLKLKSAEYKNYVEYKYYSANKNGEILIKGLKPGTSNSYSVIVNMGGFCGEQELTTLHVSLPNFNKYYTNEICEGLDEYSYCQKWANFSLTEKEFVNIVTKYKKSLEKVEEPELPTYKPFKYEWIVELMRFLNAYVYYVAIPVIVICIGLIIYLKKKDDFKLK